ncbi:hypothetical protein BJP27_18105 [Pseudomonas oryzihabitans]|nr:hypothetical protein BJP27_18105 [Pseudomonas psychrotolerans]
MAKNDLVRPSRDGDQFHYHWAARQCLALLPGSGDLVAVTIEGPSVIEGDEAPEEGDELIDVGLYHGAETLKEARYVRYIQLKHSTRHALDAWTASGLSKTIRGFTQRYAGLLEQYSVAEIEKKICFEFTTNRPIDSKLCQALDDLANGAAPRHPGIQQTLLSYSALQGKQNADFFQLFSVEGGEPNLWAQRNLLSQDLGTYLADADYDAPVQLKELVTRKASSEFEGDPAIRRHDVLRALKVSELELLPSPCQVIQLQSVLPREQESDILNVILTTEQPVIIHADGGVGKSVLAQRLATSMPSGSESVLYDCFGDGLYRNALHYRHRHRDALVQISNELAARGLCHPLIPSSHADAKQYMRAFCSRLSQAIGLVRAREPGASLCLLIDAADNADMAAEEQHEACFVRDLIRAPLPSGVRLVFTCRTHRRHRLAAPPEAHEIELKPFNEAETAHHLRGVYPDATQEEVSEFAFLSSSNPRVQALALERKLSIVEMLQELGPSPSTVERAIGELLQRAVNKLKDRAGSAESAQIDLICQGLAVLRPLIPIAILAKISGTSESAIRSFALDLGRPLFVKGNSLHFLDEPAETWFRESFKPDTDGLRRFLDRIRPLAKESSYVASTLPQLLLAAGQMDELINLALSAEGLPTDNPLERRDVELQRLIFALKACLDQGRHLSAAKLALKAAGEVAGESRQTKLIQENTDIAATLLSPDRIDELVSRRTFDSSWMGSHHAYDAGLLSGLKGFSAEASSRLRMAMDWLLAWARSPRDDSPQEKVTDLDRAELTLALLRLRGPQAAAKFLRRWRLRHLSLTSGKLVARRLIDLGEYEQLDALADAASNDIWLLLGLAEEVASIGRSLPITPLARLIRLLGDRRVKLPESTAWDQRWEVLYAVQAAVSLAVRLLPPDNDTWGAILRRYLPDKPPSAMAERFGFNSAPMIRAYALEAYLRGHEITLIDLAPADVRIQLEKAGSYGRSQEAETFEREVGGLLPWITLSVQIICGSSPSDFGKRIDAAVQLTGRAESRDYKRHYTLRQSAVLEWLQILRDAPAVSSQATDSLQEWIRSREIPLWPRTLTALCRIAARTERLAGLSLDFAVLAYEGLEQLRDEAETRANSYVSLARAVLPTSHSEAAAYFNQAVEISSRIGDENLYRWSAFLTLARAAAALDQPRPKTAYRLSRAAELTYEYVVRDKHFDWNGTVEALAGLCSSSALTILSRWRDRRFGDEERLLPVAVYRLMEQALLPTTTPIALAGLHADWNRLDDLKRAIKHERSPCTRQLAAIAYRYMRVQAQKTRTWEELIQIGDDIGIELPDAKRLLAFSQVSESTIEKKQPPVAHSYQEPLKRRTPVWDQLFHGINLTDSAPLRAAYADLRTYDPPYQLEEFFHEGIKRVGTGKASGFIRAVAAWPDFGAFELSYLLKALPESASKMLSMRKAINEAVMTVCRREPERMLRRGWHTYLPFKQLDDDGIVPDKDVVRATLEGYAAHAGMLGTEALFQLIDPLASCLEPDEADEALNFGLDLIQEVLLPEDGDGPWCESLQPPPSCVEALAGYIWAGLGSPIAANRWQFAHVVRASIELEWIDLLIALAKHTSPGTALPFVDQGLEFYEWHARQWLLIGIARGAREKPEALHPLIPFLQKAIAEEHVLIRAFAAEALQSICAVNAVIASGCQHLDSINKSHLPLDAYSGWKDPTPDENTPKESGLSDDEKYYFGIDIGPYWFAPLGRAFGVSESAMERHARLVLRERFGVNSGKARDDARYQRKLFGERETSHSHGEMPQTDDLRAYHSYHAMMIVAARLLEHRQVRKDANDAKDEFQDWIEGHLLTRADGEWLADRRDPLLVSEPPPKENYADSTWCWRMQADYLDRQLLTDDGLHVLWGHWSSGDRNSNESITIRSALVSRNGAHSLLAALQTAPELGRAILPDAMHHENLEIGQFRLTGWVIHDDATARLDKSDPWSVGLRYPALKPCPRTTERLALTPSADDRRWISASEALLRSESWTQVVGYGHEQDTIAGTRLSGNTELLQLLLEKHPHDCLVLSVSIRRLPPRDRSGEDEVEPYPWPYVRYYLMDSDGISRPLESNNRIR